MGTTEALPARRFAPGEVEGVVKSLHEFFCHHSKRVEPLRFFQRQWYDLLVSPEFSGDDLALRRDVGFLIWYLRKRIADQKRNAGCLKLINFLEPQQFHGDLAEAREQFPKAYREHCRKCAGAAAVESQPEAAAKPTRPEPQQNLHVIAWQVEQGRQQRALGRL